MENEDPTLNSPLEPQLQLELPSEPKSNNLWLIILAVTIVVILIGGCVYYYKDKLFGAQTWSDANQKTSVNDSNQAIDISDEPKEEEWQTYTSEEYKYTVEYPLDWKYKDVTEENVIHFSKTECSIESCGFTIAVIDSEGDNLNEYLAKVYLTDKPEGWVFHESTDIEINGAEAIRGIATGPGSYKYNITYFEQDDYIYQFKYALQDMKGNTDEFKNELKLIEQVLFSFQFLDNNTADWQTYTNEELGVSFKYPLEWPKPKVGPEQYSCCGYPYPEIPANIISLGPLIDGDMEGGESYYEYQLLFHDAKEYETVLDDLSEDSLINVVRNDLNNEFIVYDEGGICGFRKAIIIGDENSVILQSHCGSSNPEKINMVDDLLDSFKFLPGTSDWQTYTNEEFNFAFQYPSEWNFLNEGYRNGKDGYSVIVGASENYSQDNSLSIIVNPDGFGPVFPNKTFSLEKSNGGLVIVDIEDHSGEENVSTNSYQVIAREDYNNTVSPRFFMSFNSKDIDSNQWDKIVEDIIASFVFLD